MEIKDGLGVCLKAAEVNVNTSLLLVLSCKCGASAGDVSCQWSTRMVNRLQQTGSGRCLPHGGDGLGPSRAHGLGQSKSNGGSGGIRSSFGKSRLKDERVTGIGQVYFFHLNIYTPYFSFFNYLGPSMPS